MNYLQKIIESSTLYFYNGKYLGGIYGFHLDSPSKEKRGLYFYKNLLGLYGFHFNSSQYFSICPKLKKVYIKS